MRRFGVCSRRYYQGVRHGTRDFFYEGYLPGFSVNTLTPARIAEFAAGANFSVRGQWVDADAGFALSLMQAT